MRYDLTGIDYAGAMASSCERTTREHQAHAISASSSSKFLLDVHQQFPSAGPAVGILQVDESIPWLQPIKSDARPCGQLVFNKPLVLDLEPFSFGEALAYDLSHAGNVGGGGS